MIVRLSLVIVLLLVPAYCTSQFECHLSFLCLPFAMSFDLRNNTVVHVCCVRNMVNFGQCFKHFLHVATLESGPRCIKR